MPKKRKGSSRTVAQSVFCSLGMLAMNSSGHQAVKETVQELGGLDILVNNAAEQHPQESIEKISEKQLERTFRTNIFSMFFLTKAAMPQLREGSAIVNTTSVTAYKESRSCLITPQLKAPSLPSPVRSQGLAEKNIRVNGVAPGPIWTPLIPSTFPGEKVETFGSDTPMKRAGQQEEVAPCYVF